MATHDKQTHDATPCDTLSEVNHIVNKYDCIGIDEAQFFPDLISFCSRMATEGKIVIVAALDGTFQRKPFGKVLELVPLAESIIKLNAVCMICSKDAPFTKRIGSETAIEIIGGSDKYFAVCRKCYS
jgi:thymidine kinase